MVVGGAHGDPRTSLTSSLRLDCLCCPASSNPGPRPPSPPQAPLPPLCRLGRWPPRAPWRCGVWYPCPHNASITPLWTAPPTIRKAFRRGTHGCRTPRAGRWASAHSCPGTRRTWTRFPGPGCAPGTASRGAAARTPCKTLGDRLRGGTA